MPLFEDYMCKTLLREGGERYTNDPNDRGGATKWGITQVRARAAGFQGDMRDLLRDQAMSIYRLYYWTQPMFDQIAIVDAGIGGLLLDLGINNGPHYPGTWLQRGLNVLNRGATDYPDLVIDGLVGALTRAALLAFKQSRGKTGIIVLSRLVESFSAVRYVELAEKNPTQERFEYGWLLNRAFQGATTL